MRTVTLELPEPLARAFVAEIERELMMRAIVFPRRGMSPETIDRRNRPLRDTAKLVRAALPPPPAEQKDIFS